MGRGGSAGDGTEGGRGLPRERIAVGMRREEAEEEENEEDTARPEEDDDDGLRVAVEDEGGSVAIDDDEGVEVAIDGVVKDEGEEAEAEPEGAGVVGARVASCEAAEIAVAPPLKACSASCCDHEPD